MLIRNFKPVVLVAAISSIAACSDDTGPQGVDLDFAAKVAGADFTCGDTYSGVGNGNGGAGHEYKVTDYRMYINNVHVHDPITGDEIPVTMDDTDWQTDNVALLDFENSDDSSDCSGTPETNTKVIGTIDGSIDLSDVEVCFEVGVPSAHNHTDVSDMSIEPPFNLPDMAWSWKFGRKYIKIDGKGDPNNLNVGFNLHLGAASCGTGPGTSPPGTQCNFPNTFEACVTNFDMNGGVINVDVAGILEGNDVTMNLGGAPVPGDPTQPKPGCMAFVNDGDCVEMFPRMALNYTDYNPGFTASSTPLQQKLFTKAP